MGNDSMSKLTVEYLVRLVQKVGREVDGPLTRGQAKHPLQSVCSNCKAEGSMEATSVRMFGGFTRFIGILNVIPSILGVLFAVLIFVSGLTAAEEGPTTIYQ